MFVPNVLRELVDKADVLVHRALVKGIRSQIAVHVAGLEIGDHFRGRHHADLDVLVRMHAAVGQEVAQQVIVHGIIKGHTEAKPFHIRGRFHAFMFVVQGNGLPIDIFHGGHIERNLRRPRAQGDGQGHGREHMRGVHVLVDRPIPYHGPSRRPFDFGVQAMLAVEPHGLGHDNRRGTGNGNKPDREIRFFRFAHGVRGQCLQLGKRKKLADQSD